MTQTNEELINTQKRKYLIRIAILIVINTIGFAVLVNDGRTMSDRFWTSLHANLIGFNIVGFILGAIVALFPYKQLTYRKKYLRSSLLTILTLQVLVTVGLILLIPLILLGLH
ncbi:hypothetical protein BGP76_19255 [Reichenbachiella sp. MSK19-1]|nr:hypothetical protein BGP76_19255 [Reichenbachiella sp. MSK19-1]